MNSYVLTALLFFLSLVLLPFQISPYEKSKVLVAVITIQFLFLVQVFILKKVRTNKLLIVPLFLIFLLSIYHLLAHNFGSTFWGNSLRYQGTFLLWHLLGLALISANLKIAKNSHYFSLASLFLLFMATVFLGNNLSNRPVATLGEPNALATSAILLWPFAFFNSKRGLKKVLIILSTLISAASILLFAQSESAYLALVIQIFLIVAFSLKIPKSTAFVSIFTILLIAIIYPFTVFGPQPAENRRELWTISSRAASEFPLLGYGFGNIDRAINEESKENVYQLTNRYVDSGHNFLLDWWVQGGIVGLVIITFLVFFTTMNFTAANQMTELTAFAGASTAMLFNPASVATLVAFWYLIGRGFSSDKQ